jgi:hypothetical protein
MCKEQPMKTIIQLQVEREWGLHYPSFPYSPEAGCSFLVEKNRGLFQIHRIISKSSFSPGEQPEQDLMARGGDSSLLVAQINQMSAKRLALLWQ